MSHKCLFVFILRISQTETCFVQRFPKAVKKIAQNVADSYGAVAEVAFDMKHFPCLKLDANRAYGYLALIAYNFLRLICNTL